MHKTEKWRNVSVLLQYRNSVSENCLKYASRRPTHLLTTVLCVLELPNLADRHSETFGFGPYYDALSVDISSPSVVFNVIWLSNLSIWSFTWRSQVAITYTRLIVKHAIYTDIKSIVEYRLVSCVVSLTILKTGTLRVLTVWFWNCSMCSLTWWNQICRTTSIGWCGARWLIRSPSIAKSSEIVRNHDFGSVSVMFRVANERENRRPDKNAHQCTKLFDMLSHVVQSYFSHDYGNMSWVQAFGNPPKSPEKSPKCWRISQLSTTNSPRDS